MSYRVQEGISNRLGNSECETFPSEIDEPNTQDNGLVTAVNSSCEDLPASEKTPLVDSNLSHRRNNGTWSMYALTFFAALGGFLFGYDTGVISGALLPLARLFHLDNLWKELVVSSTVGAAIFGAISGGWFNDKFGRKLVLITSSVIFTSGAVIMAVATEKEILLIGRLVVGVAIGNEKRFNKMLGNLQ